LIAVCQKALDFNTRPSKISTNPGLDSILRPGYHS